jgi:hypothetical protein
VNWGQLLMSVSLKWDNHNKTVLRLFFWDEWSVKQYGDLFEEAIDMIASVRHDVDILMDFRTGDFLPKFDTVPIFRRMMDSLPDNAGILVYVSESQAQRALFNVHLKFYESVRKRQSRRLYFVDDLPEAYELIEECRIERSNQARSKATQG